MKKWTNEKRVGFGLSVVIVALLVLIVTMKQISENQQVEFQQQLEQSESEYKKAEKVLVEQAKEIVYKDMKKAFSTKLTEIIEIMQPKLDEVIAAKIVKHIVAESEAKGLDPVLIAALMWEESRFDPFARSKKNAVGLMQVRYSVWKKTPVMLKNGARKEGGLFWIDINIKVGTGIFKEYYDKSGHDIAKTLWRYNSGQTKFPKGKRAHEMTYVSKVLIRAYEIKEMLK